MASGLHSGIVRFGGNLTRPRSAFQLHTGDTKVEVNHRFSAKNFTLMSKNPHHKLQKLRYTLVPRSIRVPNPVGKHDPFIPHAVFLLDDEQR